MRLKIAALSLLLVCFSVPAVTALMVLPVVEEKVAPEPDGDGAGGESGGEGDEDLAVHRNS